MSAPPLLAVALAALCSPVALAALRSAPPVGSLPKGPVVSVVATRGTPIAVALPRPKSSTGLVWRVARTIDARVVQQVGEGEIGGNVVLTFRAVSCGKATLAFALTKGETRKAYKSIVYRVQIR